MINKSFLLSFLLSCSVIFTIQVMEYDEEDYHIDKIQDIQCEYDKMHDEMFIVLKLCSNHKNLTIQALIAQLDDLKTAMQTLNNKIALQMNETEQNYILPMYNNQIDSWMLQINTLIGLFKINL